MSRRRPAGVLLLAALAGLGVIVAFNPLAARSAPKAPAHRLGVHGLHVVGNRLLAADGKPILFQGVNRSGTEYACIQGSGIFDGPSNAASIRAMLSWHINAVRVLLNEDCWLGINGVSARYGGARYRAAIARYVRLLHRYGMYVELSLIWAAPGSYRATYQAGAPDETHAPAVWAGMARAFRHDPNVILAPWGETIVDAHCFLRGGTCEATFGPHNVPYKTAGMQQAVDDMRGQGYDGVIAIPGIDYANHLSEWLSHRPVDPRRQLIAEAHVYGQNSCDTVRCFNATLLPVARRVPLILGEAGESADGSDCGSSQISTTLNWADSHSVGYETWTWDTWGTCDALINTYAGAPHRAYGAWVRQHYRARNPRRL